MFGLVEVITLLLGLSGFGLTPNPKPPTADVALQYAIPEADVVVHLDVASIVPGNYKNLIALQNQPQIKSSPELSKLVKQFVTEVEGARNLAKAATGIDLTTDISDATAFVSFVPQQRDPAFVAVVRGKLNVGVIDKIAGMTGKQATQVGSGKMIDMGTNEPSLGITKDGVMIAGLPSRLVKERLADGWKAPQKTGNASLAYAAQTIDGKPVFSITVAMSNAARREVTTKMGGKNFVTDLVGRHKSWSLSVFHDGIGWTWIDSTKPGLDQIAQMSEGWIDIMRAAQIAPRGVAKILLGALDSYKGDKRVDEIIKRKGDIWKIVEAYTGDGNFKVAFNKDPAKNRLDVRVTGKTLSEVLPAGLLVPAGALLTFGMRSAGQSSMPAQPPAIAVPPQPLPAPKKYN